MTAALLSLFTGNTMFLPLFFWQQKIDPQLTAERHCWPLISLIVSSSIFNHSVVLHFKRPADLWSQLTREGLILETEAKNALGTLLGDFAALWKLCELPRMWRVGFSWECGAGGCLLRARGVFRASLTGVCWGRRQVCFRHPADTLTGRPAQCCAVCVCD